MNEPRPFRAHPPQSRPRLAVWVAASLLLLLVQVMTASPVVAGSLPIAPFSAVVAPDPAAYATCTFKFTYMGPQTKPRLSLGGAGPSTSFALEDFVPFERDLAYENDWIVAPDTLLMDGAELQSFVHAIELRPALQDTSIVADPQLSLMIRVNFTGTPACWEHLANQAEADTLLRVLHDVLPDSTRQETANGHRRRMAGVWR
jgi:hypothetical protein